MPVSLVSRSLRHYWQTHLAVVAGVAAAVTVLSGALLVGASVRGSLRDLVLQRLGRTDLVVVTTEFFRAGLAEAIREDPAFAADFESVVPMVAVQGVATEQGSGRRAARVQVYGVDDRFWRFHGSARTGFDGAARSALLSAPLARELEAAPDATVLLRIQRPSEIPLDSLHGRKDDVGRTVRLTMGGVLPPEELGEFSLQPQQGEVRAVFVPLARLQQELVTPDRANVLLVAARPGHPGTAPLEALVRKRAEPEDLGLRLRALEPRPLLALESDGGLLDDRRGEAAATAARASGLEDTPVFTYLVNSIRTGGREIPYSLVTAIDLTAIAPGLEIEEPALPPIVLNEWAARNLAAKPGDRVAVEYYVWEDPGRLVTRQADLFVAAIVPLSGAAADRDLAPVFPGISDSDTLGDWDPPFPIDLGRVRPVDEEYWRDWRTTPKAFIPLEVGQALWRSRYGALTSVRLAVRPDVSLAETRARYAASLKAVLDPIAAGLAVRDVRAEGLAASRGATDFGEYFTYFSFFLVASAILLAALFFKLGVEQRGREVGLLRAVGFTTPAVRRLFLAEGLVLSIAGSAIGVVGALGYGSLLVLGLRTWWVDAVGTTALRLHVSAPALVLGAVGGVAAAVACIWWTLRALSRVSERSLLAGQLTSEDSWRGGDVPGAVAGGTSRPALVAVALLAAGLVLLALGTAGWMPAAGAFFGGGAALLGASLAALTYWLRRPPRSPISGSGWRAMTRLGARNTTYRPGRSVLSVAVVASATFILIAVDAFRRDPGADTSDPRSGTGGYSLLLDTVLPIAHEPDSADGRELFGTAALGDVGIVPFRVRAGDDASCLNLYEPREPRIIGAPRAFLAEGRFRFGRALDRSDDERANPWLLLERELPDGAIPVVADGNSMTYVLHRSVGDDIAITHNGQRITLRLVAALDDTVLQGELIMSEANFRALFPGTDGYQFFLVSVPEARAAEVSAALEDRLGDFGADATPAARRLAEFHKVENTYLSTFQTLGGLGLLLGTVGLAAVLLRNVLERRRELALLGAVGYSRGRTLTIVTAESALLLVCGLAIGAISALIAIAPAAAGRGALVPAGATAWLLVFAVLATGLVSSIVATRAAMGSRLLDALRAE